MRPRRGTEDSERGATLVVIALTLTALLGVSSLAIDGGRLFTARRQSQNAADAAALAGAEALFSYQYAAATNGSRSTSAVSSAVTAKLVQNGVTASSCQLVDASGTVLEPCAGASDAQLTAASGVQTAGALTEATTLAGVIGVNSVKASATAIAEVQPLVATSAPFILCGAAHTGWNILNNDGTINTSNASALQNIPVEGPQVPDCGAGSSTFKGKAASGAGLVPASSWEGVTTGNGYNAVAANAVAGLTPCPTDMSAFAGTCGMVVPVAAAAQGVGAATQLHIVNFVTLNVTGAVGGNPRFSGTYAAPSNLALQGQAAFGVHCISGSQICMVKLAS